jgi:hypothetical protein
MKMTEQVTVAVGNPFDPETFVRGGGLWDGKVVTITGAVAKTETLTRADGSAVVDEKTKVPIVQTALFITGIADGGDDKERHEEYSVGDKLVPTPDGEGFAARDGGPAKFHANSNMAKFAAGLKAAGYDLGQLVVDGKQRLSRLIGARFLMKAEAKLGRDGKALLDKKGFTKNIHLPLKFVGYATAGTVAASMAPAAAGNGAVAAKADAAVLAALAGGPLSRADLVRTLAQQLAGDADTNAIIGLVVRDDYHKGKPWKYDGTQASL